MRGSSARTVVASSPHSVTYSVDQSAVGTPDGRSRICDPVARSMRLSRVAVLPGWVGDARANSRSPVVVVVGVTRGCAVDVGGGMVGLIVGATVGAAAPQATTKSARMHERRIRRPICHLR